MNLESLRLDGKVAIVTGGGGGIGRRIAHTLADRGARVVIYDLANCSALTTELASEGLTVRSNVLDLTRSADVDAAVAGTIADLGPISILVNCAGGGKRIGFVETTDEDWFADLNSNLTATFFMMRAVLPSMLASADGSIVNISSISGIIGGLPSKGDQGRSGPAYGAAKGGIIALTKWAAREFGAGGVRVNAVAPGPVITPADMEGYDYGVEDYPVPRFGTSDDVAEAVAFLASPASGYITGECLKVSGGVGM